MEFDFLNPLSSEIAAFVGQLSSQHLGSKIALHTKDEVPDLKKIKIAIIGVLERRSADQDVQIVDLSAIRMEFYGLYPGNWDVSIADLGDILPGDTEKDTFFAVQTVISSLLKQRIIPIVIGGQKNLTYPLYRSYDKLEQMVNLVVIDNKFDIGNDQDSHYLSKIIVDEPNNLFNYCNLGFQTYYNSQESIDLIEKLFFDAYRLGEVCHNISIAEPVFRDADLVSINLTAIKSCDSGNFINFVPNGFDGKEICALSRYAGISDKVSILGLFNHNNTKQEAVLIAQIMWYFVEGVHFRSHEYPFGSRENYIKYSVPIEDDLLVFYKSDKTDRWWIEIPFILEKNNKLKKNTLLPCAYEDYLAACNQEIPERWWKAQRKNTV